MMPPTLMAMGFDEMWNRAIGVADNLIGDVWEGGRTDKHKPSAGKSTKVEIPLFQGKQKILKSDSLYFGWVGSTFSQYQYQVTVSQIGGGVVWTTKSKTPFIVWKNAKLSPGETYIFKVERGGEKAEGRFTVVSKDDEVSGEFNKKMKKLDGKLSSLKAVGWWLQNDKAWKLQAYQYVAQEEHQNVQSDKQDKIWQAAFKLRWYE